MSQVRLFTEPNGGKTFYAMQSETGSEEEFTTALASMFIDMMVLDINHALETAGPVDKIEGELRDEVRRLSFNGMLEYIRQAVDICMRYRNIKCDRVDEHTVYSAGHRIMNGEPALKWPEGGLIVTDIDPKKKVNKDMPKSGS